MREIAMVVEGIIEGERKVQMDSLTQAVIADIMPTPRISSSEVAAINDIGEAIGIQGRIVPSSATLQLQSV